MELWNKLRMLIQINMDIMFMVLDSMQVHNFHGQMVGKNVVILGAHMSSSVHFDIKLEWKYLSSLWRSNTRIRWYCIILTSISSVREAFLICFFNCFFHERNSIAKPGHPILSMFLLIERMLGWFLNLLIAVATAF